ncbi:Translation initiation factor IF-2, partial [Clarias magur]
MTTLMIKASRAPHDHGETELLDVIKKNIRGSRRARLTSARAERCINIVNEKTGSCSVVPENVT